MQEANHHPKGATSTSGFGGTTSGSKSAIRYYRSDRIFRDMIPYISTTLLRNFAFAPHTNNYDDWDTKNFYFTRKKLHTTIFFVKLNFSDLVKLHFFEWFFFVKCDFTNPIYFHHIAENLCICTPHNQLKHQNFLFHEKKITYYFFREIKFLQISSNCTFLKDFFCEKWFHESHIFHHIAEKFCICTPHLWRLIETPKLCTFYNYLHSYLLLVLSCLLYLIFLPYVFRYSFVNISLSIL